jgi:hypothetical protein
MAAFVIPTSGGVTNGECQVRLDREPGSRFFRLITR